MEEALTSVHERAVAAARAQTAMMRPALQLQYCTLPPSLSLPSLSLPSQGNQRGNSLWGTFTQEIKQILQVFCDRILLTNETNFNILQVLA